MSITKQCTDRIVTIMPDGQFTLDRVLAIQTDVVLDPTLPGYDKESADKVVHEAAEMMQAAGDMYDRAEVYMKPSKEFMMDLHQTAESILDDTFERFHDKPMVFHIEYLKEKLKLLRFTEAEIGEAATWNSLKRF